MNLTFKTKLEKLINTNIGDSRNRITGNSNLYNDIKNLKNSFSSSKYITYTNENINDKKNNVQDFTSSFNEFLFQKSNSKLDNKKLKNYIINLKKNSNSKNYDLFYKKMNKYNFDNSINKEINNSLNISNTFNKSKVKKLKEKINNFTKELKNNNSFINRPISYNLNKNLYLNEYISPLNNGRVKNLSRGKSITNLFNDSNNNKKINQFNKKRLIITKISKKIDNKKIIQDYMKEFNIQNYNKKLYLNPSRNKIINFNF